MRLTATAASFDDPAKCVEFAGSSGCISPEKSVGYSENIESSDSAATDFSTVGEARDTSPNRTVVLAATRRVGGTPQLGDPNA